MFLWDYIGYFSIYIKYYSFFCLWKDVEILLSLLSKKFYSPLIGLIILCVILGILALPILTYISLLFVNIFFLTLKSLNFKKILQIIKCKFFNGNKIIIVVINIVVSVIIGTFLLFIAYCLPVDHMEKNVRSSAETISQEGAYFSLYSWCNSQIDNWTDSVMLLEASDNTKAETLKKVMYVYRGVINDLDPAKTFASHYNDDVEFTSNRSYARYWHGYLIIIKPLLLIFNYSTIRIINGILQLGLLIFVCFLLKRKGMKRYILPYILCYLALMPTALAISFQFSSCYYIFTAGIIVLLLLKEHYIEKYSYLIFLNIGIATGYFDFLTYPISTFGMPVIIYIILSKNNCLENKIYAVVRNGFMWCVGFGGMWCAKWGIASIITGENVITDAVEALSIRTSSDSFSYVFDTICMNFNSFIYTPFILLSLLFILYILIKYLNCCNLSLKYVVNKIFPYIIIFLVPILWYVFATNHSYTHFWFTCKSLVVSMAAILFLLVDLTQNVSISQK